MRSPSFWLLGDVIDFEHFLTTAPTERELSAHRDGQRQKTPAEREDRARNFRDWIEVRRAFAPHPTPGECFQSGYGVVLALAVVGGLLLGASATRLLLAYPDPEPINAPLFFLCTAGLQIGLLLLGGAGWLARRWLTALVGEFSPLRTLVGGLVSLAGLGLRRLPGERRESAREAIAILGRRRDLYGSLAGWPLLIATQLFAVAFNAAVLVTLLAIHLPFVELRFGWQSTYDVTPAQVHRATQLVAVPWSWAVPHGHPTLTEVERTRYAHRQSAKEMPAETRAWWPFLACAVAVYGLLPRLLLLTWAASSLGRALKGLRFQHAEANTLWRLLHGPVIAAQGGTVALAGGDESPLGKAPAPHPGACLVLAADELSIDQRSLRAALQRSVWELRALHQVPVDHARAAGQVLERVRAAASDLAAVLVVVPGARDPIVAVAKFLREVEAAAEPAEVVVWLTGPAQADGFGPVGDERFAIWQRFRNLQRLRASIERWNSQP